MAPRLSIVVPFYNVESYIHDCLDSLARQTFEDFEAVLVDDGSRDGSADIAKAFCGGDRRFRLVTQENQGLGPARNTGVRHCQGEYITFVDSDDLVPRHAYEAMIRSLDETGSSFAAGNARRFNNSSGVRQSWAHRIPFAIDRQGTHIFEFPQLTLDRMIWNKVYRRSFWDEFHYQFPPIRYEDYPVTLKAHIDAVTVDCLSMPVYYWRERETGESITQQKFEYSNLYDRVLSAEMVMDLLDKHAPELRGHVQNHFAQIDLTALAQAFGSIPAHEQDALLRLGQRLIRRFNGGVWFGLSPYDRIQYRALKTGDVDLLQRLAQFRLAGGLHGRVRARRHPVKTWVYENQYPGLHDNPRSIPRRLYRLARRAMYLYSTVSAIAWQKSDLIIRGTAEVRHLPTDVKSKMDMSLVYQRTKIHIPFNRFETLDSHGDCALVGFEARVPGAKLATLPREGGHAHLSISLRTGQIRRRGTLSNARPGNPQWAPGHWVTNGVWIQPIQASDGRLLLRQIVEPSQLTSVEVDGDTFIMSGRLPAGVIDPRLALTRPSGGTLTFGLEVHRDAAGNKFTARVPSREIVDITNPDDPFTGETTHGVHIVDQDETQALLATGLAEDVSTVYMGRLLTITRSSANHVSLHEGPIRVVANEVNAEPLGGGHRIVVHGRRWDADPHYTIVWRRFLEDSNDYADVPCKVMVDDHSWSAAVDFDDLLPPHVNSARQLIDPLMCLADWTLFALPLDASPYAVHAEMSLVTRLPIELDVNDQRLILQPRAGALHLEVH